MVLCLFCVAVVSIMCKAHFSSTPAAGALINAGLLAEQLDGWHRFHGVRTHTVYVHVLRRDDSAEQCNYEFDIHSNAHMQMFMLCQNDELCAVVYASKWYMFDPKDQRDILMLLARSQKAKEMWIGQFAPLNVQSGLQVIVLPIDDSY